jgi:hypothetical protein
MARGGWRRFLSPTRGGGNRPLRCRRRQRRPPFRCWSRPWRCPTRRCYRLRRRPLSSMRRCTGSTGPASARGRWATLHPRLGGRACSPGSLLRRPAYRRGANASCRGVHRPAWRRTWRWRRARSPPLLLPCRSSCLPLHPLCSPAWRPSLSGPRSRSCSMRSCGWRCCPSCSWPGQHCRPHRPQSVAAAAAAAAAGEEEAAQGAGKPPLAQAQRRSLSCPASGSTSTRR